MARDADPAPVTRRIAATSDPRARGRAPRASIRATQADASAAHGLLQREAMVIPHRDWLLLRGRMRAVAKISVLPMLLKPTCVAEPSERDEDEIDDWEEERDV